MKLTHVAPFVVLALTLVWLRFGPPEPTADDAPTLVWPFLPGTEVSVYQTYGQPEGAGTNFSLHPGLDLACRAGTPVFSPTDGTVVTRYGTALRAEFQEGLVILPPEADSPAVQLLHLDPDTIPVGLGDEVRVGDYLGDVIEFPPGLGFETHLHVAVGLPQATIVSNRDTATPSWAFHEFQNPLLSFDVEDVVPPTIVEFEEGTPFRLRAIDVDPAGGFVRSPEILAAPRGLFDVEVRAFDVVTPGSPSRVAPFEVVLELERSADGVSVLRRGTRLDGFLNTFVDGEHSLFVDQAQAPAPDATFVFHALTLPAFDGPRPDANPTSGDAAPIDAASFSAGEYVLSVAVRDAAGNETTATDLLSFDGR